MKVEMSGILKHLEVRANNTNLKHVVVALSGRIKGEIGKRYHVLIIPRVTSHSAMVRRWVDWLETDVIKQQQ